MLPEVLRDRLQLAAAEALEDGGVELIAAIDAIFANDIGLVASRNLLAFAVEVLSKIPNIDLRLRVGEHVVAILSSETTSFDEQDMRLRMILADAYIDSEQWTAGARMLQGVSLDSSQVRVEDQTKAEIWIKICRLYLEADDPVTGESYLNRVKALLHTIHDPYLHVTFQLSRARILDSQRRFLDAGAAYFDLYLNQSIDEEERERFLNKASVCTIMAPAGPQRSRLLARLYKDERLQQTRDFTILQNIYLNRLLPKAAVNNFAKDLDEHQLARLSGGSTVLEKAVIEHNLLSASYLYVNISIDRLAQILNLPMSKAENYASAMLQEKRLKGSIDQVDQVLDFCGDHEGFVEVEALNTIQRWNDALVDLAAATEAVATELPRLPQCTEA